MLLTRYVTLCNNMAMAMTKVKRIYRRTMFPNTDLDLFDDFAIKDRIITYERKNPLSRV